MPSSLEYPSPVVPEESGERVEKIETPNEIIHSEINVMLRDARRRNEGAAGIIIKLELGSFSSKMIDALQQLGILVTEDAVAKLLKVYSPGAAKYEFLMQQKAYEIIQSNSDLSSINSAKISRALFYSEISVDADTADNLRSQGIELSDSNKVEILLMDWIPGDDLLTKMYKKVLEFFPDHPALPDNPDDFQQLRFSVSILMGLEAPNTNVISAEQKESNEALTYRRNMDKIHRFFRQKKLEINPQVSQQLENSIDLLHKKGVWHNDLHERNVAIVGDIFEKGEDADITTYLIDFGSATSQAVDRVVSDRDLLNSLKKNSIIEESLESRLEAIEAETMASSNFKSTFGLIEGAAKINPQNAIQAAYALFLDDSGYKTFIALNLLMKEGLVKKEDVKQKLVEILDNKNDKRFTRRKNLKEFLLTLN